MPTHPDAVKQMTEEADRALADLSCRAEQQFAEISRSFTRIFTRSAEQDLARLAEVAAKLLIQMAEIRNNAGGIGAGVVENGAGRASGGQVLADVAAALAKANRNL